MLLRITQHPVAHRIAIIDDSELVLEAHRITLEEEGHLVRTASSIEEGVKLVREFEPDLVLLDYMMPGGSGADVVHAIREFNELVQVVLVSGVKGERSIRNLLADLDIQGFVCKDDGEFHLLLQVDAALKHSRVLKRLQRQRQYLRSILEASPELSRLIPLPDLYEATLQHVLRLVLGSSEKHADGLIALEESSGVNIQAASGCFTEKRYRKELPVPIANVLCGAMDSGQLTLRGGLLALPFQTRNGQRGCMLVRASSVPKDVEEPCMLYVAQVVQALENTQLYEQATVDALTRVYNRDYVCKRLHTLLDTTNSDGGFPSVMLLDVDHFKRLNDTYGHAAGDEALRQIAAAIRRGCRKHDVVARYGGEEFLVVFPDTPVDVAEALAENVLTDIRNLVLTYEGQQIKVTASAGVAGSGIGSTGDQLIAQADEALYRSKRTGRNRVTATESIPASVSA